LWQQFEPALGHGERWGLKIRYSHEGRDFEQALRAEGKVALETAGGISRALPMLADDAGDVFFAVGGDVFCPTQAFFAAFNEQIGQLPSVNRAYTAIESIANDWACMALVPNPDHNIKGDFSIDIAAGSSDVARVENANDSWARGTYSTMGAYRARMFEAPHCAVPIGNPQGQSAPLAPLLRAAANAGRLSGRWLNAPWTDVGTPERLARAQTEWLAQAQR
jgi:MurNAc alpha-1-phosphate uridylyltransferase